MNLWPNSPAKEGPLRDLGNVGYAFADQISSGIINNTGKIHKAAIIAARAAMPPIGSVRTDVYQRKYIIAEELKTRFENLYNLPHNLSPELGYSPVSIPKESLPGYNGMDMSGLGAGGMDNFGGGGAATAPTPSIIYITQHFERDSIILSGDIKNFDDFSDKVGKQINKKIVMGAK